MKTILTLLILSCYYLLACQGNTLTPDNNATQQQAVTNPTQGNGNTQPTGGQNTNTGNTSTNTGTTANSASLPEVFKQFNTSLQIYVEGNFVVIKSNGLPDHKTPYYKDTQWASTMYEVYNGTNTRFNLNPNRITSQNLTFKIPVNPAKAGSTTATPLGPIGVSLNGIPFFNQYAAQRAPLTNEINSFDQYNGHPQPQGQYHYHVEPTYLTTKKGKDVLLGFLLDGFPVYGPMENGKTISNSDLDAYHGHSHTTKDYPNGIYHYHITSTDPYINGNGFYGSPGTVSQ